MRVQATVCLAISACAWCCAHAVSLEVREAAQKVLLRGVEAVDVGGGALPGPMVVFGEDAFPLAESRTYDGTHTFAAAGAMHGLGRVVALSHPGFLVAETQREDAGVLVENALGWLSKGKKGVRVVSLRNEGAAAMARALGYTVETVDAMSQAVGRAEIVLSTGFRKDEVGTAKEFVKRGGGLLWAGLGWGFLYYNKTACFAEDFADNQVLGAMGILMGDTGVNRVEGVFPAVRGGVPREADVEMALKMVPRGAYASLEDYQRDGLLLGILLNALPEGVNPVMQAQLEEILETRATGKLPSPEAPLTRRDVVDRLVVLKAKKEWLREPEKVWPASPMASVYPGAVKAGTPTISRTVVVDTRVPRWHSTGVYSPAGQALTVSVGAEACALGLRVRVGSTADDLTGNEEWKRAPMVTLELPLVKEETTFATPFGGLVYIVVPEGAEAREVDVQLSGGVMAPWFKLGRDSAEKFVRECAETGAPYGEIEGPQFVLTSETRGLKRVENPEWIAGHWERVMAACAELGQTPRRTSPERFCSDVQLTAGFLHNGYPMMCHINEEHFDLMIDREWLANRGEWGCYHEIGHNHQKGEWTPGGTTEVTVNLFTMYVMENVGGVILRDDEHYPLGPKQQARRIQTWKNRGATFEAWKRDYFLALEMYYRIKEAYGWEPYKRAFARYQEPGFQKPRTDDEKWQIFALEMSRATGANIADALAAWSIPISQETLEACAKYPPTVGVKP